ncbi:MAG TPA: hypothetical protein VEC95_05180 [Terriglobales bacterium]|nr:hypothetical protein [Terriglobales bacterium]
MVHGTDEGSTASAASAGTTARLRLPRVTCAAMLAPAAAASPSGKVWLVHVPHAVALATVCAFLVYFMLK